MAKTIAQILGYRNILGLIEAIKGTIPTGIIPDVMLRPTKRVVGNKGTYFKVESMRKTAKQVMYGAPSVARELTGVTEATVTLLHAFEHILHNASVLIGLKSENNQEQEIAMSHISRQTKQFAQLFVNTRLAAWYAALSDGHIYYDKAGNLLPNAHGAVIDVDFGVPAGNKGTIDALGAGAIVTGAWNTAATDIAIQIIGLQKAAMVLSGYRIKNAFYGKNIPSYLAKNTVMKEFLKLHPQSNEDVRMGKVPNGFLELNWIPAHEAMYVDDAGTARFFWGDSAITFTPDPADTGWWGMLEGTYPIPRSIANLGADAISSAADLFLAAGIFSYAKIIDDPVAIKHHGGDTFLPYIAVPKSVFYATDVT